MHTAAIAKMDTKTLVQCALCTALIAICSWINIPATVPFTLQTFAVFLTCDLLGGAAVFPVLLYMLLGAVGVPVFAGFSGGLGVLIQERIGFRQYEDLGMVLLCLFVVVFVIENTSEYLRKKLS